MYYRIYVHHFFNKDFIIILKAKNFISTLFITCKQHLYMRGTGSCKLSRHSKRNQGCKITTKTTTVYQAGRDKLRNNLINTKKKYILV